MTKTDIVIICAFYVFFLFAMGVFAWAILNYAKDLTAILIIPRIELKELKAVRQIKLEEDHHYIGESSATIDVIMIGLENMERKLLITLEDWQNQNI